MEIKLGDGLSDNKRHFTPAPKKVDSKLKILSSHKVVITSEILIDLINKSLGSFFLTSNSAEKLKALLSLDNSGIELEVTDLPSVTYRS